MKRTKPRKRRFRPSRSMPARTSRRVRTSCILLREKRPQESKSCWTRRRPVRKSQRVQSRCVSFREERRFVSLRKKSQRKESQRRRRYRLTRRGPVRISWRCWTRCRFHTRRCRHSCVSAGTGATRRFVDGVGWACHMYLREPSCLVCFAGAMASSSSKGESR
ncbi:hypothetical protein BC567DRAFT_236533 [Phyllosticta citribraziliensis]